MATPASVTTSTINAATMATATATNTSTSSAANSLVNNNHLLFFVALGFGVLFTNLWIIIGVKYCFRYQTARRRGLTLGPDGVPLGNMHHGRRRREKKLMTIEEVQTQFPLMTYKSWRAQREREGLSTEGGVQAVGQEEAQTAREILTGQTIPSRAASIRTVRTQRAASLHIIEPVETSGTEVYELGQHKSGVETSAKHADDIVVAEKANTDNTPTKRTSIFIDREVKEPASPNSRTSAESTRPKDISESTAANDEIAEAATGEDEVDEAQITHLPEDIGAGDTCAICIDQLEEDDEVRGLSCGHAFHSSCVDVWLTTRRAICPLCKKDYWVRRTPTESIDGSGATEATSTGPTTNGAMPTWRRSFFNRHFHPTSRATNNTTQTHEVRDLEQGRHEPVISPPTLARMQIMAGRQ